MTAKMIMVAGMGRCGTSMMMQMLDAGGVPCLGNYPDFEDDRMMANPRAEAARGPWLADHLGYACKWIDPHRIPIPDDIPRVTIFMQRTLTQQAKSMFKLGGNPHPSRNEWRAMRRLLTRDEMPAQRACAPGARLRVKFEDVLRAPLGEAQRIKAWLDSHDVLVNARDMASQVLTRRPECLPDRGLEQALINKARFAAAE